MPWDSGRTDTSVRTTREERTGTDEGLMGRNGASEGKRKERKGKKRAGKERIITRGLFQIFQVFVLKSDINIAKTVDINSAPLCI